MKRLIIYLTFLGIIGAGLNIAHAGNCSNDTVVKRWLDERDRAEERVIKLWAKGNSPADFASDVAVIFANEIYLCSQCRDNVEFLKARIHILKNGSPPKVETVPSIILEQLLGKEFLSPWKQFPSERKKGAREK